MRRVQNSRISPAWVVFHDPEKRCYWVFHTPRSPYHHTSIGYFRRDQQRFWPGDDLRKGKSTHALTWDMKWVRFGNLATALKAWERLKSDPQSFLMRAVLS